MKLEDLPTPAFVINRHAFAKNCRDALEQAARNHLKLRPHVKTHKTIQGAYLQATGQAHHSAALQSGDDDDDDDDDLHPSSLVSGFVASTLPEIEMLVNAAEKYGGAPFNDILFGVPIASSKLSSLVLLKRKLARQQGGGQIRIMVDHEEQVRQVEEFVNDNVDDDKRLAHFTAFLKLDTGYHRAGVPCDERGIAVAMAMIQSSVLELVGVYSHCGHAYDEDEPEKRDDIAKKDIDQIASFLRLLQSRLDDSGAAFSTKDLIVSVGSTPSLKHHSNRHQMDNLEIHPGNYTLYDRQQLWVGACTDKANVAGRVVTKVIGHYQDRNTILLDAGALALSKDTSPQGGKCEITGFPELECFSMSQEVTQVRPKDLDAACPYSKLPIGSTVSLLPNHSCLSAACFAEYYIIDDRTCSFAPEEPVVDVWTPAKYFSLSS